MKFCSFFLVVLLVSCNAANQKEQENTFSNLLPRDTAININYEVYNTCTTYYYSANDTTKPRLSRIVYYDKSGREKNTTYISFEDYVPATSLKIYDKDGREIEAYYRVDDRNSRSSLTKNIFELDENGKIIRTIEFDFVRRMKKGIVRGIGTPGGCIVRDEDYERVKSWALKTVWNNVYDKEGRLIEIVQSYPEKISQDSLLYKYDKQGRLTEERSLTNGHQAHVDRCVYYDGGYEYSRTFYEPDGTIEKIWNDSLEYIDTFRFKVDRFNNMLEEKVIENGGRLVSRERNYYDEKNRIVRKEIYGEYGRLLGFYIHQYTTSVKPQILNFCVRKE